MVLDEACLLYTSKQAIMDELKEYAILIAAVREANPALKDADIFDVI